MFLTPRGQPSFSCDRLIDRSRICFRHLPFPPCRCCRYFAAVVVVAAFVATSRRAGPTSTRSPGCSCRATARRGDGSTPTTSARSTPAWGGAITHERPSRRACRSTSRPTAPRSCRPWTPPLDGESGNNHTQYRCVHRREPQPSGNSGWRNSPANKAAEPSLSPFEPGHGSHMICSLKHLGDQCVVGAQDSEGSVSFLFPPFIPPAP